jgi:hypothetical protein
MNQIQIRHHAVVAPLNTLRTCAADCLLQPEALLNLELVQPLIIEKDAEITSTDGLLQQPSVRKIDWRVMLYFATKLRGSGS